MTEKSSSNFDCTQLAQTEKLWEKCGVSSQWIHVFVIDAKRSLIVWIFAKEGVYLPPLRSNSCFFLLSNAESNDGNYPKPILWMEWHRYKKQPNTTLHISSERWQYRIMCTIRLASFDIANAHLTHIVFTR